MDEEELQPDEITIDSHDLQVMRDSVDTMQQQLSRALRDIQEIRAMVNQAAAQRELERHGKNPDTINRRCPK
ncbi:hypothetical protein V7S43_002172 [Phytophthora oleae]|uniref:Syntaxin N-terminal domain-containing protein n=1 Tax=Phytophthora oleae TaxID=2107226 RepID=A0ABD3G153_9STRA